MANLSAKGIVAFNKLNVLKTNPAWKLLFEDQDELELLEASSDGKVKFRWNVKRRLSNGGPAAFGGAIAGVVDLVTTYAIIFKYGIVLNSVSLNLSCCYAGSIPVGEPAIVEASFVGGKPGKR